MLSDFVGLSTLLVVVAIGTIAVSAESSGYLMAGFIYLLLALIAHYFWHQKDVPATPRQWLLFVCGVPLVGGAVFLVEGVLGQLFNPDMGFIEGALHTGPFGGALTAIATAGMSAIGVAGLVRSFFVTVPANIEADENNST
ncbi:MAG: hypothetical protein IPH39_00350 [Sulfuritalea sp.]|jgi:hypothetical protein|nr:hypothetical protein [Sulfuritalea sp.]